MMLRQIPFASQVKLPMEYKGLELGCAYRMDFVVDDLVILELKSMEALEPIHDAQLLTYLGLSNRWLGLLINFNVAILKNGIRRIVLG